MTANESCEILVFRPSYDEFKNFSEYIKYMESKGAHKAGIAKVIPPKEWCAVRRYNMKKIGEMEIETPVSQTVTGQQGLFQLFNVQKKRMKIKEFKELAESVKYKGPESTDLDQIERKFWKNITFNPAIYAADVPGSIYDKGVEYWNINSLNTILDVINSESRVKILGVNTAYLYFGMWKTMFPWHTEDMDLYSINYLHFGASKSWYAVPPEHGKRLETLAKGFFSGSFQDCPEFLRHKMTIISPQVLKKFSIPLNKITQHEGEFMITFPYGYHAGYNHGFNCAESTNFASLRWINYGKKARYCNCKQDSVKIQMDIFIRKFQPKEWKILQQERSNPSNSKRKLGNTSTSNAKQLLSHENESDTDSSENNSDESDSGEESEEILDSDVDQEESEQNRNERSMSTKKSDRKYLPNKSKTNPSSKGQQRTSFRQKKLKRHPIHQKEKTLDEVVDEKSEKKLSNQKIKKNVTHTERSLKNSILKDVWRSVSPFTSKEILLNKRLTETETKCAVCVYFSQTDADMISSGSYHKTNKRHTLSMLKSGLLLVSDLCFAMTNSEEEAMEVAYSVMFGGVDEEELKLLVCSDCFVAVHSKCYGVSSDVDCVSKWYCDKCAYLRERKESRKAVKCQVKCDTSFDHDYMTIDDVTMDTSRMSETNKESLCVETEVKYSCTKGLSDNTTIELLVHNSTNHSSEERNGVNGLTTLFTNSLDELSTNNNTEDKSLANQNSNDSLSTNNSLALEKRDVFEDITCCLCFIRGGALKRTTDGHWCHIVCAITFPEVYFEDKKQRGPINTSNLNLARKKLNCIYCSEMSRSSTERGACVQCQCGKCATPFHVTCSFYNGVPLYLGDWPVLIETLCRKHVKNRFIKTEEREMPEVCAGDAVIAKHKNGRFYNGRVLHVNVQLFYKVVFEDKSFCFDLPPEDIQGVDAHNNIIPSGETVDVLWPDDIVYHAEVTGHWNDSLCQVRFEDSSILNIKRSDLYLEGEEIPKRVRSKLSYASETANKLYLAESLRTRPKRPRIGTRKCASVHKKL